MGNVPRGRYAGTAKLSTWTIGRWSASSLANSSDRASSGLTIYVANEIWIGDDPTDRLTEITRIPAAIIGDSKDVVVQGFVIERFANPAQRGAIHAEGAGWTIEHNEVRANHGTGVYATGGHVLDNHIHHNGQLGLGGTGDGQVIDGNQIDHNNTARFSPLWEAGGTKFVHTDGLVIRGNSVHNNKGPGLWTDINNIRTTIERNIVHANTSHGIFHEIGYRAVIRDNHVTDNGGDDPLLGWGASGIRVAASPDVEIYGNFLAGNQNAIMLVQQRRDDCQSPRGAHLLRNIDVHDNQVTLSSPGLTGQVDDTESGASYGRNIRFHDNVYRLPSSDMKVFAWQGGIWDPATWKQRFDQDASSIFILTNRRLRAPRVNRFCKMGTGFGPCLQPVPASTTPKGAVSS
jgi:hypothetical protein